MEPSTTNAVSECSIGHDLQDNDNKSDTSKEVNIYSFDHPVTPEAPKPFTLAPTLSYLNDTQASSSQSPNNRTYARPVTSQPLRSYLNLPSPMSINIAPPNQPQTLFLQALAKLNESSASFSSLNQMKTKVTSPTTNVNIQNQFVDDYLTPLPSTPSINAPPSYSFVLRQMTYQRRPRLMGTFIPSPSFVVHTPPPNYTTGFDIYVDNPIGPPQRPTRVFNFGYTSMPAVCPECGFAGMTIVTSKITLCTHLCAVILCLFCCWICAPLPYLMMSCKDVYHYCRNCQTMLGMYCPTDPDCYPS